MRFLKYFGRQHFINGSIIKNTKNDIYVVIARELDIIEGTATYKCIKFDIEDPSKAKLLNYWFRNKVLPNEKDFPVFNINSKEITEYTDRKIDERLIKELNYVRYRYNKYR